MRILRPRSVTVFGEEKYVWIAEAISDPLGQFFRHERGHLRPITRQLQEVLRCGIDGVHAFYELPPAGFAIQTQA